MPLTGRALHFDHINPGMFKSVHYAALHPASDRLNTVKHTSIQKTSISICLDARSLCRAVRINNVAVSSVQRACEVSLEWV